MSGTIMFLQWTVAGLQDVAAACVAVYDCYVEAQ